MPSTDNWDPLLRPYLEARSPAEEDEALEALLREVDPVIRGVVRQRAGLFAGPVYGGVSRQSELLEDLRSAAVLRLLETLNRIKEPSQSGAEGVQSFKGLAETLTRNLINAQLRERYPRRASLQNQVLYVVQKYVDPRTGRARFALWVIQRDRLCGYIEWRERPCKVSERYLQLQKAPAAIVARLLPEASPATVKLLKLLVVLFDWLATPLRLDDLVAVVAQARGVEDQSDLSLDQPAESAGGCAEPAERRPTPEQEAQMRAHLERVWESLTQLPPQQCAALLLNLTDHRGKGVIDLFPALGIAGIRQIAAAMQLPAETLAQLWPQLPLDDESIGRHLGCPTGRVAVWRCRARKKLSSLTAAESW